MNWWKCDNGDYVNSTHVHELEAYSGTENWAIRWFTSDRQGFLDGTYGDQSSVLNAIRRLVQGFDPDS